MSEQKIFRCAVYTRKSSEEGLEQDFNSLEAQREACEAYVRSQAHEGWKLLPDRFDDGGFSGGNMERPALGKLMSMIRDGKVDVIVIYKIDRLTRSLTDFARLAETFDKHGVSFVSVTQQFNTTTSMGRLMLNVLLSFAQFEREITGERIRDKIAASKKKGMWMGGPIPMGYDVKDRQLVINEAEAEAVRRVFELYLDEGNVPALLERLVRERIKTPVRTSSKGKQSGGRWFTRGHVYKLLSNPLYIGQIAHKGVAHPGQHEAIVDRKVWDAVQTRLAKNTQGERTRRRRADPSIPVLAGLLYSEAGNPMIPMHSVKSGRRYDYYVEQLPTISDASKPLAHPSTGLSMMPRGQNRQAILRLPAAEIDRAVTVAVGDLLLDRRKLLSQLGDLSTIELATVAAAAPGLLACELEALVTAIARRATIYADLLRMELNIAGLRGLLGLPVAEQADVVSRIDVPLSYRKRGVQLKMTVSGSASEAVGTVDPTLATAIARAFDWFERLSQGRARSIDELAGTDGFDPAYVSHIMTLAFHSPKEITRILEGKQRPELTGRQMIWNEIVPVLWDDGRLAPPARAVLA